MKNISFISIFAAFVFAACSPEFSLDPVSGMPLAFQAALGGYEAIPESGPGTKASSLSSSDGDLSFPLDYSVSEQMRFVSLAGPQTKGTQYNTVSELQTKIGSFNVTAWDSDGTTKFLDNASVSWSDSKWVISGTVPVWKNADTKTFFAYSNLPSSGASVSCTSTSQTFSYTVPATAAAQNDILLGYYKGNGDADADGTAEGVAAVTFEHPLTAVKFVMGSMPGVTAINSITIEDVYGSGTATATYSYSAGNLVPSFDWGTSRSTVTTVTQSITGSLPAAGTVIGVPFIILPQNLATQSVTVKASVTTGSGTFMISGALTSGNWQSGKTNVYTLGFDPYSYSLLTVTGNVLTDYQGNGDNAYTVTSDSPWTLQYTTDGGSTWTDAAAESAIEGWISFDKVSGAGTSLPVTVTATITPATGTLQDITVDHNANLRNATPRGTESAPWDLSMHDIFGNENASGMTTANCYVVSAPGWYSFPLVYGAAIKNGAVVTESFIPTGTAGNNFLTPMLKGDGSGMDSPYIVGATSAYPLWEDVSGYAIISNTTTDCKITGTGTDARVVFHVNQTGLTQSNSVIAVTDGTDILWSWHIWVTDLDLTPVHVKNADDSFEGWFLPCNLGWVDKVSTATTTGYPAKSLLIRFVQKKGDEVKREVNVTAKRKDYYSDYIDEIGSNPTYRWGRKDPMMRSVPLENEELTTVSGAGLDKTQIFTSRFSGYTVSHAIQHPDQFISYDGEPAQWYVHDDMFYQYYNLWVTGTKTVYDPCPPGFVVPPHDKFATGFSYDGSKPLVIGTSSYGYFFKTGYGDNTIFFPATGDRNPRTGALEGVGKDAYYWSSYQSSSASVTGMHISMPSPSASTYHAIWFGMSACVRPVVQ